MFSAFRIVREVLALEECEIVRLQSDENSIPTRDRWNEEKGQENEKENILLHDYFLVLSELVVYCFGGKND